MRQGFAAGLPAPAAHFGLRLPEPVPEGPVPGGPNARRETGPGAGTFSGTGFCVHPDGYVLTNHHVVEGASEIRIARAARTAADIATEARDFVVKIECRG